MNNNLWPKPSERSWKHRFSQTLYEVFCLGGREQNAALEDAYAHADAQYLVRSLASPEDDARSALIWIQSAVGDGAAANCDHDARQRAFQ